jgi:predicted MPP superfamily phosphohydrolase
MVLRALASLDAPLGKWAILGNHDVEAPRNRAWSVPLLRETGFTVLENEGIELCGLPVWGFANALHYEPKLHNETYSNIRTKATKTLGLTEPLSFSFYLVHESDWFTERISAPTPGMILSGHSHHGQVTFFGIPLIRPRMGKKHWKGFYKIGDRFTLIVSAGLGTVHIHARFFCSGDAGV